MRERWTRGEPALTLTREQVATLLPDRTVLAVAPTDGGLANTNLRVRSDAVAAVLDWEFAFSGSPFVDLGNVLRPPRGDDEAFVAAVAEGYGPLPPEWRRMSRLVDLMAWADFLSRPNPGPALVADARMMIERAVTAA